MPFQAGDQGDVLADRAAQQLLDIADDLVHVQHPGSDHLTPGERQELVGQVGPTLPGPDDLLRVGGDAVQAAFGGVLRDERRVVQDHRDEVVEVVRDTAGELAEALQALGTLSARLGPDPLGVGPEPDLLRLGLQPFGDVPDHGAADRSVVGVQVAGGDLDRQGGPVVAVGQHRRVGGQLVPWCRW